MPTRWSVPLELLRHRVDRSPDDLRWTSTVDAVARVDRTMSTTRSEPHAVNRTPRSVDRTRLLARCVSAITRAESRRVA